jgi:DNA-binding FadR family transcriptional regulator
MRDVVAAIAAGDPAIATYRARAHMEQVRGRLRPGTPQSALHRDEPGKRAEAVAADIYSEILAKRWPVGELLGSEWDLITAHNVSRAVLREAVRLLEHHRIAEMRRGRGGGLIVARPDQQACTRISALYLAGQSAGLATIHTARKAVELACLDLVVANVPEAGLSLLRTVRSEKARYDAGLDAHDCDLHAAIAALCGNPVLGLFSQVLSSVYAQEIRTRHETIDWPRTSATITATHERIVQAIAEGEPDLARRRMSLHLDLVQAWFDRAV